MLAGLNQEPRSSQFALWGPQSSGKTSLLYAFAYKISQLADENFFYRINEGSSRLIDFKSPEGIDATEDPQVINWGFERRAKGEEPVNRLSSHYHRITVFDDRGESTVSMLQDSEQYRVTLRRIEIAKSVMILLDHTLLQKSDQAHNNSTQEELNTQNEGAGSPQETLQNQQRSQTGRKFTKRQYYDMVCQLCTVLENAPQNGGRGIAVCFTKVDRLSGASGIPAWELIDQIFNARDFSLVQKLQELNRGLTEVGAFAVSSLNKDSLNSWEPINVERPFFWLFERSEKERLRLASRSGFARLFVQQRLANYRPYPKSGWGYDW